MVITALLAFLVGGSGQAFQAVACPSHDGDHAGILDGPGLDSSEAGSSKHHGVVDHGHGSSLGYDGATHGSTRLDGAAPPPEDEGHPCTCLETCRGSAVAERATPRGLAPQHALSVPGYAADGGFGRSDRLPELLSPSLRERTSRLHLNPIDSR